MTATEARKSRRTESGDFPFPPGTLSWTNGQFTQSEDVFSVSIGQGDNAMLMSSGTVDLAHFYRQRLLRESTDKNPRAVDVLLAVPGGNSSNASTQFLFQAYRSLRGDTSQTAHVPKPDWDRWRALRKKQKGGGLTRDELAEFSFLEQLARDEDERFRRIQVEASAPVIERQDRTFAFLAKIAQMLELAASRGVSGG